MPAGKMAEDGLRKLAVCLNTSRGEGGRCFGKSIFSVHGDFLLSSDRSAAP